MCDHGIGSALVMAETRADLRSIIKRVRDPGKALTALNRELIALADAVMNTSQGAIMAKAGLVELGVIEHATVRLPLVESTPEHLEKLRAGLAASGLA